MVSATNPVYLNTIPDYTYTLGDTPLIISFPAFSTFETFKYYLYKEGMASYDPLVFTFNAALLKISVSTNDPLKVIAYRLFVRGDRIVPLRVVDSNIFTVTIITPTPSVTPTPTSSTETSNDCSQADIYTRIISDQYYFFGNPELEIPLFAFIMNYP